MAISRGGAARLRAARAGEVARHQPAAPGLEDRELPLAATLRQHLCLPSPASSGCGRQRSRCGLQNDSQESAPEDK